MRMLRLARLNLSKKGANFAFEAVMWIARSVMLICILLSIVFITSAFLVRSIDTRAADSYVLMNLVYYSPDGMAITDSITGRAYPGVTEPAKAGELKGIFSFGEEADEAFIAAKADVFPGKPNEFAIVYNSEAFKDWDFLYKAGLVEGKGGVKKVSSVKKIVVVESGKGVSADATFGAITKNV